MIPSGQRHNASPARLVIVCGLPGSGKTTYAKQLEPCLSAIRFCPDEWMAALSINLHDEAAREKVECLQWQVGRSLLAVGQSVIIEWGTWAREERDALRLGARAVGAAVELHYLNAPVDVLFERIQKRAMEEPPIERGAMLRWLEIFEEPSQEEMSLYDAPTTLPPGPGYALDCCPDKN